MLISFTTGPLSLHGLHNLRVTLYSTSSGDASLLQETRANGVSLDCLMLSNKNNIYGSNNNNNIVFNIITIVQISRRVSVLSLSQFQYSSTFTLASCLNSISAFVPQLNFLFRNPSLLPLQDRNFC